MSNALTTMPVAIIGMSCRFPQAHSPEEFWNLLSGGLQTVSELSGQRWDIQRYYDPDPAAEGKVNQKHASLLDNIDDFDPLFFNISPSEAMEMSPSQKLMLELAWEAMENSTTPVQEWRGSETGVYIGNIWNDFEHLRKIKNALPRQHSAMGQSTNLIANRISYAFGFSGPSLVMDTGCSSSLVALHLALQGLWEGSTRQAVAGGINHTLDIEQSVLLTKFGGLSGKGRCSTFDSEGDGFVRGEGAGLVLLKRLEDAERDGDHILAVIKGSAMNNNGFNQSLPATSVKGQLDVLERAYRNSGIVPGEVHFVEAHGTGTKLGDPTECNALGTFFSRDREKALHIGSVKTNVGHTEAAAGMAGLIKVILAMQNRQLPKNLNFNTPNPAIDFEGLKLKVQAEAGKWPLSKNETMKAGVNSFGWGGTNAHVVLEEYRPVNAAVPDEKTDPGYTVLPLSARSTAALKAYAKSYSDHFKNVINGNRRHFLDVCEATAIRKMPFEYRLAVHGSSKEEIVEKLEEFIASATPATATPGPHKVAFVFPGQGSQWQGMGKELYRTEPVFRKAIEACEAAYKPYVSWSLSRVLFGEAPESSLSNIDIIQPALCAVMISLARLWQSKGIQPDAVTGHSMGEVAAAYIGGAISLEDAARVICTRSKLMKTVAGQGGAMAVTELTMEQAAEVCEAYNGRLSVAVNNSATSTVLAGKEEDIEKVLAELEAKGLFCKKVKVDVASHSPQMDPLIGPLAEALHGMKPQVPEIPVYSTVRAEKLEGAVMDCGYWVSNLRGTVKYAHTVERLLAEGYTTFIEVSPHPVLTTPTQECVAAAGQKAIIQPTLIRQKPERETFLDNFGELFTKGLDVDWKPFFRTEKVPACSLPAYPFQRETYALEDRSALLSSHQPSGSHPMVGEPCRIPGMENVWYWEIAMSASAFPYLKDHRVGGEVVVPGAAFTEIALAAGQHVLGNRSLAVNDLHFAKALYLSEEQGEKVYLKLEVPRSEDRKASFIFYRQQKDASANPFEELCQGQIDYEKGEEVYPYSSPRSEMTEGCDAKPFYKKLTYVGLDYGPAFQGLTAFTFYGSATLQAYLDLPDVVVSSLSRYHLHPALLDSCFQTVFAWADMENRDRENCAAYLTAIKSLRWIAAPQPSEKLRLKVDLEKSPRDNSQGREIYTVSMTLYSGDQPVFVAKGVEGTLFDTAEALAEKNALQEWLYEVAWQEVKNKPAREEVPGGSWVVIGDSAGISDKLTNVLKLKGLQVYTAAPVSAKHYTPGDWQFRPGHEEDIAALFALMPAGEKLAGIIHTTGCRIPEDFEEEIPDYVFTEAGGGLNLVHTVKAAANTGEKFRFVTITNGINELGSGLSAVNVSQSSQAGLVRVIANEYPEWNVVHIDLGQLPGKDEIEACAHEVLAPVKGEAEISLRGSHQYVPRLRHMSLPDSLEPVAYSPEATYLVTGFRGLGFSHIEQMISQGARYLLLLSRSGLAPAEVNEKIQAYRREGIRIEVMQADVSDYDRLAEVFEQAAHSLPPIKGIVHAAGIIRPSAISDLSKPEYLQILSPKVKGAWNLHLLSKNLELDHFVMFSSASALIGLSGQASYVAANAYLDALATYRKQKGLSGTSVQWGVIKDVGMVADKEHLQKFAEAEGFEFMKGSEAMEVFSKVYRPELSRLSVCRIDGAKMSAYYQRLAASPYFEALAVKQEDTAQANVMDLYAGADTDQERLTILNDFVKKAVASIIKSSPDKLEAGMSFSALGVDSLMTIQLRNSLESALKLKLAVTTFKKFPSIGEYAAFLAGELGSSVKDPDKGEHQWLQGEGVGKGSINVICFHDAGGDASLYHNWHQFLGEQYNLVAIELPGRNGEAGACITMGEVVEKLLPQLKAILNSPYIMVGHSMGGAVLYEVLRKIREENLPMPLHILVSSVPALDAYDKSIVNYNMPEERLTGFYPQLKLENLGGDKELQQKLISAIRADMRILTDYNWTAQHPWNVPLTAICAKDDNLVTCGQAKRWEEMTTGEFNLIRRPGGHRYIAEDGAFLTDYLKQVTADIKKVLTRKINK